MAKSYQPSDAMSSLITDNYSFLQVMSRFGIPLGFGDKTIAEVCAENDVDCHTFLAVVNFALGGKCTEDDIRQLSVPSLLQYLKQSHIYFLDYCLPDIRHKLMDGIRFNTNASFLILKFFDEYTAEVKRHMEQEEETIFNYVNSLSEGTILPDESVSIYSKHHEQVGEKLNELKRIIIRYCPATANTNLLNLALYDIYRCEKELENHCAIEDEMFVPAIRALEIKMINKNSGEDADASEAQEVVDDREALSDREKEIIIEVAKGFTNKEIADKLYLSIHTVTTHRRNIARKLEIHSATGLTIYAIANKLVDISDIHL